MAAFFLKATGPHRLERRARRREHPDGRSGGLTAASGVRRHLRALPLEQGANAGRRARSDEVQRIGLSGLLEPLLGLDEDRRLKQQMREIVPRADFLDGNYLSTELRVPVTLLQTNACSPLATNALAGNIWDNFSSQSYKICRRSDRSPSMTRSPASRRATTCRPAAAAIRARHR